MATKDVRLELSPVTTVAPQSIGGAVNGADVSLVGTEAALIVLHNGAATTPATIKVQEAPDSSGSAGTYTDVADSDLIGLTGNTSGVAQTASTLVKVAYIGNQPWIRVITTAGTAALFSASVIKAHQRHQGSQAV